MLPDIKTVSVLQKLGLTIYGAKAYAALVSIGPTNIAIAGPPYLKFVLIDNRETLIMFSRVDENISDLNNVVAIWVSNSSVASYVASNFNMTWNTSNITDRFRENGGYAGGMRQDEGVLK